MFGLQRTRFWAIAGLVSMGLFAACSSEDSKEETDTKVDADVPGDIATPDVAQEVTQPEDLVTELPTLPKDKTFTTSFAAGAATVTINGEEAEMLLGGYGLCLGKVEACRFSEGVHDDLHASAVALAHPASGEVIILVGLDSVGMLGADIREAQQKIPEAFAKELGVKMDGVRVVVGSSHSHDTPDLVGLWGPMDDLDVRDEIKYINYVQDKIVEVALAAYGNLGDIELKWGQSQVVNDDTDKLSDDHDLFVLQGKRPGGETVFTWVRGCAHPTVYPMEMNGLSADWIGPFRKKLQDSGAGIVVYHNGPIGSVYPKDPENCTETDAFPEGWQDPEVTPEMYAKVTCVGYEYADAALEALENSYDLQADKGLTFRHQVYWFHPTNFVLMQLGIQGPLPIPEIDVTKWDQLMDSYFSWITLGNLEILTTPGEAFPTFSLHAKDTLSAATEGGTIITLGLTQDWLGYLLPMDLWTDPDLAYHRTLCAGETIEPAFQEALQKLVDESR